MYQLQVHEDTVYPWSPNESLSVLQVRRPWGGHLHLRMTFFGKMNVTHIYVFSDESGVFDQINNDTFAYAGIIFTDLQEKNLAEIRYRSVENRLRKNAKY